MNIDNISPLGIVGVVSKVDGINFRKTLTPGTDISTEPPEVQAACNKAWTPEVIAAYEAHKAEQL